MRSTSLRISSKPTMPSTGMALDGLLIDRLGDGRLVVQANAADGDLAHAGEAAGDHLAAGARAGSGADGIEPEILHDARPHQCVTAGVHDERVRTFSVDGPLDIDVVVEKPERALSRSLRHHRWSRRSAGAMGARISRKRLRWPDVQALQGERSVVRLAVSAILRDGVCHQRAMLGSVIGIEGLRVEELAGLPRCASADAYRRPNQASKRLPSFGATEEVIALAAVESIFADISDRSAAMIGDRHHRLALLR